MIILCIVFADHARLSDLLVELCEIIGLGVVCWRQATRGESYSFMTCIYRTVCKLRSIVWDALVID